MNTADRLISPVQTVSVTRFISELTTAPAVLNGQGGLKALTYRSCYAPSTSASKSSTTGTTPSGTRYFLEVTSLSDLGAVFRRKVLPLLQEYFYGGLGQSRTPY